MAARKIRPAFPLLSHVILFFLPHLLLFSPCPLQHVLGEGRMVRVASDCRLRDESEEDLNGIIALDDRPLAFEMDGLTGGQFILTLVEGGER